jgi:hypothetical protein
VLDDSVEGISESFIIPIMYSYAAPPPLPPVEAPSTRSSAAKAGWICIVAGIVTVPLFGFGFLLLGIAIVLSIVAMATNQIKEGFFILFTSIASMVIGWLCIAIFIVTGTVNVLENLPKPPKAGTHRPSDSNPKPLTQSRLSFSGTPSQSGQPIPTAARLPETEIVAQVFSVERACGLKPTDLVSIFPGAAFASPGSTIFANNWKGWRTVQLTFNPQNRLATIIFVAHQPLEELRAKRILREQFQFMPDSSREVRLATGIAYRNIPGAVRMADLHYVNNGRLKLVNQFAFYFEVPTGP